MRKIQTVFGLFLTLNGAGGCSTLPPATKFDANWIFIQRPNEPVRACLEEKDVQKLRKILLECQAEGHE